MNDYLLTAMALLPAAILCIYVFLKDRVEKEPFKLLLTLFLWGVAITLIAGEIEGLVLDVIEAIFKPFGVANDAGQTVLKKPVYLLFHGCRYFIGVALVEEALKWAVLVIGTRKNKNFNSLFDGLIYSVFVSLGFAAFENLLYSHSYGWSTALARAVTAVPAHMFFAVLMGYYYSFWNVYRKANAFEESLAKSGVSRQGAPFPAKQQLILSLLVPTLAHGLYDFCCTYDSTFLTVLFYLFLAFLYFFCFGKIRKLSKMDTHDHKLAQALVYQKYPI